MRASILHLKIWKSTTCSMFHVAPTQTSNGWLMMSSISSRDMIDSYLVIAHSTLCIRAAQQKTATAAINISPSCKLQFQSEKLHSNSL